MHLDRISSKLLTGLLKSPYESTTKNRTSGVVRALYLELHFDHEFAKAIEIEDIEERVAALEAAANGASRR